MKIHQLVQKLLVGHTHTHTQAGDLISLLSFLESRLENHIYHYITPREMVICNSDGVTGDHTLLQYEQY
jgi:hypothetical protein